MFGRRRKKTKADDIVKVIKTMSYAEMMEMGKQLYVAACAMGLPPISDDQFARIMYEWTRIEDIEPILSPKSKAMKFNGAASEH